MKIEIELKKNTNFTSMEQCFLQSLLWYFIQLTLATFKIQSYDFFSVLRHLPIVAKFMVADLNLYCLPLSVIIKLISSSLLLNLICFTICGWQNNSSGFNFFNF